MKTLMHLWQQNNKQPLKVRYANWDQNIKYFHLISITADGSHFVGVLDCGEDIIFSVDSDFWTHYHDGLEYGAKAA